MRLKQLFTRTALECNQEWEARQILPIPRNPSKPTGAAVRMPDLWTLRSSFRPIKNIDDIVEKTIRIDAGLDAVKSERGVWNPGFVA